MMTFKKKYDVEVKYRVKFRLKSLYSQQANDVDAI